MGRRGDGGTEGWLPAGRPKISKLEADGSAQKERPMVAATTQRELIEGDPYFSARPSNNNAHARKIRAQNSEILGIIEVCVPRIGEWRVGLFQSRLSSP